MAVATKKVKRFKVLEGTHYQPKAGVPLDQEKKTFDEFRKGDIVSSYDDLCHKYPGKFELMDAKAVQGEDEDEYNPDLPFGKEVTTKYPAAQQAGMRVFRNSDKKYTVTDAEDLRTRLNPNPLDKEQVKQFLSQYVQ